MTRTYRFLDITDRKMSRRAQAWTLASLTAFGLIAVCLWITFPTDGTPERSRIALWCTYGAVGFGYFWALVLAERPARRQFLSASSTIVGSHIVLVTALDFTVVPPGRRFAVALETLAIGPGLGIGIASAAIVALIVVGAIIIALVSATFMFIQAARLPRADARRRIRAFSAAGAVLGGALIVLCSAIAPDPPGVEVSHPGRGAGGMRLVSLFLQSFGIIGIRPGWFPISVVVLFVLSLVLVLQFLTRPMWLPRAADTRKVPRK
ncbi:hypothetical protein ITJ50_04780 [Curtobacterium sp. VKM Ac-2889]|uniref:hypothetical protein n=1 Tax=unclassified Curtobacterium TaxID=257496 RepID=UPI00188B37F7|nr:MULTISPECIES: hypothetical protein [unclassified Curtobacterium]MBF4598893.1 hypothetical protein [Curtobacterium sp. VKM Ac-1796]MBF4610529.1 hypothetical protein [Curtobacterium sp. VKM Ac-2889]